ncbi:MAG TPA: bifunctional (p)ppGpp synthetase/guanosine-3',5'-bis(diphosphate) 3'-pyrophosphohydrolase [Gaiellaceae bacterium]|jgi:GTP pyrophosphokinase|nr:bifunctional (p)ppGpp synthetase/guanosine-3',5'-bis(diphosphate) 3'-pyrophosphohydrolase [Gaiellaceae bacterium]
MAAQVLTASSERHRELFDQLLAEVEAYNADVDRELLERAYVFACEAHEQQQRRSGEAFIHHPLGVAHILAELRRDDATIAAALIHDVVEDTEASIEKVRAEFGEEIARLVEGVTKLTRIHFHSREQAQAENYRKMVMAMAEDYRVILIKLADRLHNMRTIEYLGKQKQLQKARETLEVYAPLAHRLGIHSIKWELEDLAFQTLHPRKYVEIQSMVNERRADREKYVEKAGRMLKRELEKVGIQAETAARAKHFYSIYEKMAKRGKEFNEIYDLTAMRVLVEQTGKEGERDCYGALGIIHSLWKPMPGRFKDYVAMPKFNMYRSLHTTVIGPEGKPLEIQVRTREMHRTAEQGIAAHWLYKGKKGKKAEADQLAWMKQLADWQREEADPQEFKRAFPELASDEVYVFTPKGEVKNLPGGSTPIDFAYAVHTDVGHRTVGAKVNGRIVPLHYGLKSGDIVEILTSKQAGRGPSRDWLSLARSSRARNKIRQWFSRETREETEQRGRESLESALKQHNLPYKKLGGSPLLAQIIREMGFKKAEDFYLALGSGKLQVSQVANKVLHRLKTEEVVAEEPVPVRPKAREAVASQNFGIHVPGVEDVLVRLAKCCTPVPGDDIAGYISLGKGITIHRRDCPNVKALMRNPERFTPVEWDGGASQSFRVQIAVVSWDRARLLEDVARTFAEHGANIVEYGGHVQDQMAKNWYVAEVGDIKALRALLNALRNIESVFDAFRVTPS